MKNILYLLLTLSTVAARPALAQKSVIEGRITLKDGQPLAYANVFIVETLEGTVSGQDGHFRFESAHVGVITVKATFMGYRPKVGNLHLDGRHHPEPLNWILEEEAVQGETITVTASSFTASDDEGTTLTALDVVRTPGAAADLFWAVKALPGVVQAAEGAGLFVRGGDVSETAIYLDGGLIRHPYRYESPNGGFFGTFSPFLLKGTYFSTGGYGARYGHGLSGVVAMESLDMPHRLSYGLGMGLAAQSAFLSVPVLENRLGLSLSGNLSNTELMFRVNGDLDRFTTTPESNDLNISLVGRLSKNWQLKVFQYCATDRVGVHVEDPDFPDIFQNHASNRFSHMILKGVLTGGWILRLNGGFSRYRHHPQMSSFDVQMRDDLTQWHGNVEKQTGCVLWHGGLEYLSSITHVDGAMPLHVDEPGSQVTLYTFHTRYRARQWATHVSGAWAMGAMKCTAGLRASTDDLTGTVHVDPRLSLAYGLSRRWTLTAAAGRYHQLPEARYFDATVGNPDLRHTRSVHLIGGVSYENNETSFRAEGYYKDYRKLLLQQDGYVYSNGGSGWSRGFDLFFKTSRGAWSGWISYSWVQARRHWMDIPQWVSPEFDITHNLTAVLNWQVNGRFNIGSSWRGATGKPYTPSPDAPMSARVPAYWRLDLTLGYTLSLLGPDMTILYASCSNVLGRKNIMDYAYSEDYQRRVAIESAYGRHIYFGFQLNF